VIEPRCVISHLCGGLGNQLFQYAAGRSVSLKRGLPLKLDIHHYETDTLRRYVLDRFCIKATFANPYELPRSARLDSRRLKMSRVEVVRKALFRLREMPVYREKIDWKYDPHVFCGTGSVYLKGYWQTENYFADIADTIRDDFKLQGKFSPDNSAWAKRLEEEESVAIHVRRGDIVREGLMIQEEYYTQSVRYLEQRVKNLRFYLFSDDPKWVTDHVLPLVHAGTVVDHNGEDRDYEEIILMSHCKYHLLANSTFSWWSAWLCRRRGRIVIAPKVWPTRKGKHPHDLIPRDWIRL
jgi:hypothetical protein